MKITTKDLSIGYETNVTRKHIDFNAKNGDFVCLLGANGTGKSTLLKTIAGIQPQISGSISFNETLKSETFNQEIAKLISFAYFEKGIEHNCTVEEYVTFGRIPHTNWFGTIKEEDKTIIEKSLIKTNLDNLRNRLLYTLSEGELQRCIIAKSLAQDTPIILLDETTSHLDIPSKISILNLLKKTCQEDNKIIILSTHDIEQTLPYATHLWMFLADGSNVDCIINDKNVKKYFNRLFLDITFENNHFQKIEID